MARIRSWPGKQGYPAFGGVVEFKTRKGQIVASTWPRKRGKKATPAQKRWRDWFKQANWLAKHCDPEQQRLAIEYTRGTGLYPRDLLLMVMSRGLVDIIDGDGPPIVSKQWVRETVVWQGAMLRLAANKTIGTGVSVTLDWPVPILQSLPFWNAGSPSLLTIPQGINVVELFAGTRITTSSGGYILYWIVRNPAERIAVHQTQGQGNSSVTVSSGPVKVSQGDEFRVVCNLGGGGTLDFEPTFFGLNVLDAD